MRVLRGVLIAAAGGVATVLLGIGALHLYHRQLLDLPAIERAVEARIARAEGLRSALEVGDERAALAALGENLWSGASIRLDERLAEAQIVPSSPAADSTTERARGLAFNYEGEDAVALLPPGEGHRVEAGMLVIDAWDGGTLLSRGDLDVLVDDVAEIQVRIRLARGGGFRIGWSPLLLEQWPDKAKKKKVGFLDVDVVDDGQFHVYRIDARHSLRYRLGSGDVIRSFLLQPSDTPADRVEIDFVRFVLRREQYDRAPGGLTHETFEGELRPAVYAISPCDLRFEIAVPGGEPRLDFGMGILERDAPLQFSVLVEHGGRSTEVFARRIGAAERWHDARVGLAAWAGERIGLVLRVAGPGENVAFWASPRVTTSPKQRLYVLMILEDALRAGHLSLYGHERETSPFKERLASSGVLFEHAFSQATRTRPSCPSFMTSLYPTATGVWSFRDRLDDRYLTLAEVLRGQGFETASFIQNANAGPAAGLHQGFDHVWNTHTMGTQPQQIYGDHVLRWIARHRDRNLFVYLHALDPHGVYDPPAPYDAWYREGDLGTEVRPLYDKIDPDWETRPTLEGRRRLYDGEIRHNDARLESFIGALDRLGILEDSLLVFMSDHGEHLGEHALWIHKPPGFVQVLHVPLLMVHPRLLPRGVRISEARAAGGHRPQHPRARRCRCGSPPAPRKLAPVLAARQGPGPRRSKRRGVGGGHLLPRETRPQDTSLALLRSLAFSSHGARGPGVTADLRLRGGSGRAEAVGQRFAGSSPAATRSRLAATTQGRQSRDMGADDPRRHRRGSLRSRGPGPAAGAGLHG